MWLTWMLQSLDSKQMFFWSCARSGAEGLDFGGCQRIIMLLPPETVEQLTQACVGREVSRENILFCAV